MSEPEKVLIPDLREDQRRRHERVLSLRGFRDTFLRAGSLSPSFHRRLLAVEGRPMARGGNSIDRAAARH